VTPRYGVKLDYHALPADAWCQTTFEGPHRIDTYHLTLLHKAFPEPLNVVVRVKTHLRSGKCAHAVLFSTDLSLSATQIVDYYSLRFQIEFNFRDAKQFWGLEDFMNVSPTAVTNATNLAFLMVNLSTALLHPYRHVQPDFSPLDLKALYRSRRYLLETIKYLPDPPGPDLISVIWRKLSALGGIRARQINQAAA
jgi:putative transposase